MRDEAYIKSVQTALLSYQMIEEALKICVGLSYEIIAASTPDEIDFKFSGKDINNSPLGSLIRMFSKVSKNEPLVAELNDKKLTQWRNFFAHSAFVHEMMNASSKTPFAEHSVGDVKNVASHAANLVSKLGEEIVVLQRIHKTVCGG